MTASDSHPPRSIFFESCVLDPDARELRRAGMVVDLEPRAFDLLYLLAQRPEHSFTKDEIAEALWPGRVISDTVISQAIRKARQACGDKAEEQRIIKTLHGVGYRFNSNAISGKPIETGSEKRFNQPAFSQRTRYALWAVTALLLLSLSILRPWQPTPPALPERITIASLPATESDLVGDSLSAGIDLLLSRMAAERSDIQLITEQRTARTLEGLGLDPRGDDAVLLEALRQTLGIDYLIRSSVDQDDDGYRLRAELVGPGGRRTVLQPQAGVLASMVRGFASDLAAELGADFRQDEGIPVLSEDNFVNEAYVRALNALLAGDNRAAATLFASILELDPELTFARYEMGNAHWQLGEHDLAREHYQLSLDRALDRNAPRLAGHAATMIGVLDWQSGSLDKAEARYEQALDYYAKAGDDHGAASALGNLGNLADLRGDLERAAKLHLEARDRFRAAGDLVGESATFTNLAVLSRLSSRVHEAHRHQRQAAEMQRQLGIGSMLVRSLTYLAALELELGDWEQAQALLDEAMQMAADQGNHFGMAEARLEQARLALHRLNGTGAIELAELALSDFEQLGSPAGQALALTILAEADLVRGEPASALERLSLADEKGQTISKPRDQALRLLLRAQAKEALGRLDDARSILHALLPASEPLIDALARVGQGSLAWTAGEPALAMSHWREALDKLETLDEPAQRARLRIRLSEAHIDLLEAEVASGYLRLAGEWNPNNPPLKLQQARLAVKQGRTEAAANILLDLLDSIDLSDPSPFRHQIELIEDMLGQTTHAESSSFDG